MRRRRAGGRAAGMVVADERAAICGEAALDRDHAIVREGVARTDRQDAPSGMTSVLPAVQRCIAKQCRIADDRARNRPLKSTLSVMLPLTEFSWFVSTQEPVTVVVPFAVTA